VVSQGDTPVPAALSRLANQAMSTHGLAQHSWNSGASRSAELGPTDAKRLSQIAKMEVRSGGRLGYLRPAWLDPDVAIPGFVVSIRYTGQDAHGITHSLRTVDLAMRRAAVTVDRMRLGETLDGWPTALRPERGGLLLLDSRTGSFEAVATVYGSLVSIALSSPIALASAFSLVWDAAAASRRFGRWVVRRVDNTRDLEPLRKRDDVSRGEDWGLHQTKALTPVMKAAAAAGSGLEYEYNSRVGTVRLVIYPQDALSVE
jgi:hypothetical protein